jgi:hypothetical protein
MPSSLATNACVRGWCRFVATVGVFRELIRDSFRCASALRRAPRSLAAKIFRLSSFIIFLLFHMECMVREVIADSAINH